MLAMNKTIYVIILLLLCQNIFGQPSYSIEISFRLFNGNKPVDCSAFDDDYTLLTDANKPLSRESYQNVRQGAEVGYCKFRGDVVYNDLVRKIVHGRDTMTLYFKNHLDRTRFQYKIDTLRFRKGYYYLSDSHVSNIDHGKAHRDYREVVLKETLLGNIKNQELYYKCYDCRSASTDSIAVFIDNGHVRKKILSVAFNGYYLDEVRLVKIKRKYFIYIRSGHTFGNSDGQLYALDDKRMEALEVIIEKNADITKRYNVMKEFGLSLGECNTFTTGYFLRSDKDGKGHIVTIIYKLKRAGSQYRLVPVRTTMYESD